MDILDERGLALYFNPRTPRGVRLKGFRTKEYELKFQSTHPARGATVLLIIF